ncbi:lycopene cyclase family protein [Antarcticibacterium sp. 1MA-6-2]|uniref:lycopene cyclase family protein n=1 Tax=Antarcticibacterium sp. 1MA-6-2 TaxID=2908210 RepID=UPI001F2A3E4A|nr:lycopene cyclase family protein [Antarcticibacterium sp. 1MA-6-2]UJH91150.1 lycopene cyclase family protein [Antarcticibacterium sp. 1MA-6-2]
MQKYYDYIIIGGGLAGLQLALHIGRDRFFEQRSLAIIEPSEKNFNDKTWCFWEKGKSEWDGIIIKSWKQGYFISSEKNIDLSLSPYSYKMLRSIDFYDYVKSQLEDSPNIKFIKDKISDIDKAATMAYGESHSYNALHIFDSRVTANYAEAPNTTTLFQHFKGWMVETETPQFDPAAFTMMDFKVKYKNSTSFTYVLPITEKKALIEFTFFTPYLTREETYDEHLEKYLREVLNINDYSISETEKGVIPMTDYPFHKESTAKITKIGTGGSWVKGSTGYSFKSCETKVIKLIQNIKEGKDPAENLINERSRIYDSIFLDVLSRNNELGEQIFTKFYSRNSPQEIFRYLDEESDLKEELKIMFSLFHPQFIYSFFRKIT